MDQVRARRSTFFSHIHDSVSPNVGNFSPAHRAFRVREESAAFEVRASVAKHRYTAQRLVGLEKLELGRVLAVIHRLQPRRVIKMAYSRNPRDPLRPDNVIKKHIRIRRARIKYIWRPVLQA